MTRIFLRWCSARRCASNQFSSCTASHCTPVTCECGTMAMHAMPIGAVVRLMPTNQRRLTIVPQRLLTYVKTIQTRSNIVRCFWSNQFHLTREVTPSDPSGPEGCGGRQCIRLNYPRHRLRHLLGFVARRVFSQRVLPGDSSVKHFNHLRERSNAASCPVAFARESQPRRAGSGIAPPDPATVSAGQR